MHHLSQKLVSLSLSSFAWIGITSSDNSAFAQGTPLPQNQPALIDTQLPTRVLDILMHQQDQAIKKKQQQAVAALNTASLNKKSKKNKAQLSSDLALPEASIETKNPANKTTKTITKSTPLANVGLPIAIQNRIDDLSPDFMPELKGAAEPTIQSDTSDVLPLRVPTKTLYAENAYPLPPGGREIKGEGGGLESSPRSKTALLGNLNEKFQAWKEKPREPIPDHIRNIVDTVINTSHEADRNGRPLHYEALSGIAIFPVIRHGEEKAFGDIPLLFAREYSNKMASVVSPETHIYNPIYTVESIKQKGIGAIYDQMMEYYIRSGRPDPKATHWLLKQITENGYPISRIMFVESDVDMNNPEVSSGLKDRVQALLTDATPQHIKMMVKSRVQVFDAENPNMPRLWGGSWQRSVDFSSVRNMTKSVYDDTDSENAFGSVSRRMSQELLYAMPRTSYMTPVYNTGVHAEVLKTGHSSDSNTIEAALKPAALNNSH